MKKHFFVLILTVSIYKTGAGIYFCGNSDKKKNISGFLDK